MVEEKEEAVQRAEYLCKENVCPAILDIQDMQDSGIRKICKICKILYYTILYYTILYYI